MPVQHAVQTAPYIEQSAASEPMPHVVRAARAFQRACQLTGLSSSELARRLSPLIGKQKPLSRQTLADWRLGRRAVPLVAFLAACELAQLRPPMIFALAAEGASPPSTEMQAVTTHSRALRRAHRVDA